MRGFIVSAALYGPYKSQKDMGTFMYHLSEIEYITARFIYRFMKCLINCRHTDTTKEFIHKILMIYVTNFPHD